MASDNPYSSPQTDSYVAKSQETPTEDAWRDGPYLVLRRKGADLPDRCIICDEQAIGRPLRFTVRERMPDSAVIVGILFALPLLLAYYSFLEKARLKPGLCAYHHAMEQKSRLVCLSLLLAGIALIFSSFLLPGTLERIGVDEAAVAMVSIALLLLGLMSAACGAAHAILRRKLLTAKKVDRQFVWLANVAPAYLARFPDLAELGADE